MNPLLLFSGKDDSISICIPCLQFGCCYLYQSFGIELSPCLFWEQTATRSRGRFSAIAGLDVDGDRGSRV